MNFTNNLYKFFLIHQLFFFINICYAENLKFKDLKNICLIDLNSNFNFKKKEKRIATKESCFLYITGYLEVANHNCEFDLLEDNLHKLDTTGIKFEQILKSLNIYSQKFSTNKNGNAIDHLWTALNKQWPCRN